MVVVSSLVETAGLLRREPRLVGLVYGAAVVVTLLSQPDPGPSRSFATLVRQVLVLPLGVFVLGGVYGTVDGALDGESASVDGFLAHAVEHFLPLLGAVLIAGLVAAVLGLGLFLLGQLLLLIPFANLLVIPALVAALVVAAVGLQFFEVFVVVAGVGADEAIEGSFALLRAHPVAVAGYTLARVLLYLPALALFSLLDPAPSVGAVSAWSVDLAVVLVAELVWVALLPYHVLFFRSIRASGPPA